MFFISGPKPYAFTNAPTVGSKAPFVNFHTSEDFLNTSMKKESTLILSPAFILEISESN